LIDGGSVTVPTFGIYSTNGKWIIEGHGVDPDIPVVDDPFLMAKGRDPQLERAIDEVMNPSKTIRRPTSRNQSILSNPVGDAGCGQRQGEAAALPLIKAHTRFDFGVSKGDAIQDKGQRLDAILLNEQKLSVQAQHAAKPDPPAQPNLGLMTDGQIELFSGGFSGHLPVAIHLAKPSPESPSAKPSWPCCSMRN
jgi:hypothetical protein